MVLYFQEEFFGKEFLAKSELYPVEQLLRASKRGIAYTGEAGKVIVQEMKKLHYSDSFERIIGVLTLLNTLVHSTEGVPARPHATTEVPTVLRCSSRAGFQEVPSRVKTNGFCLYGIYISFCYP